MVAVVGSRNCGELTVDAVIDHLPPDCTEIVSGGAMGVDALAREAARRLGLPFTEILPDYTTFGRMAPVIRNGAIVERADMVLAFWDYHSRGTRDALKKGLAQDKPVKIIPVQEKG